MSTLFYICRGPQWGYGLFIHVKDEEPGAENSEMVCPSVRELTAILGF